MKDLCKSLTNSYKYIWQECSRNYEEVRNQPDRSQNNQCDSKRIESSIKNSQKCRQAGDEECITARKKADSILQCLSDSNFQCDTSKRKCSKNSEKKKNYPEVRLN